MVKKIVWKYVRGVFDRRARARVIQSVECESNKSMEEQYDDLRSVVLATCFSRPLFDRRKRWKRQLFFSLWADKNLTLLPPSHSLSSFIFLLVTWLSLSPSLGRDRNSKVSLFSRTVPYPKSLHILKMMTTHLLLNILRGKTNSVSDSALMAQCQMSKAKCQNVTFGHFPRPRTLWVVGRCLFVMNLWWRTGKWNVRWRSRIK